MTNKTKVEIKAFFETGDTPTAAQFIDAIDSWVDKSGPIGTIETAASAGEIGFAFCSANRGEVLGAAAARTFLGATVYTTALASAVASDTIAAAVASTAQANAGTATGVLMNPVLTKNAITALGGSGAVILLGTGTASSSATLDFTSLITSTYATYFFEIDDIAPATDGAILIVRTSTDNGATYDAGASDYQWRVETQGVGTGTVKSATGDTADASIRIGSAVGNDTAEGISGRVTLRSPLGTARYKYLVHESVQENVSGAQFTTDGQGTRLSTGDVTAIRFLFDSGNIASGKIRMYGILA